MIPPRLPFFPIKACIKMICPFSGYWHVSHKRQSKGRESRAFRLSQQKNICRSSGMKRLSSYVLRAILLVLQPSQSLRATGGVSDEAAPAAAPPLEEAVLVSLPAAGYPQSSKRAEAAPIASPSGEVILVIFSATSGSKSTGLRQRIRWNSDWPILTASLVPICGTANF
jgi:hypothetical protein